MRCFKSFFQHTWHPQQMVILPSPGSIWDYPYLDQINSTMDIMCGTRSKPEQELFPHKIRLLEKHMESPSGFELGKKIQDPDETELGEVKVVAPSNSVATATPAQRGSIPCRNGRCKSWTSHAEPQMESPWHFLKTIFLISVIVALVIWVIVYTFLAQYQIL